MRKFLIGAGLWALKASRLHALARPLTQGIGAVLMFHHVRPFSPPTPGFAPNRLLEITPEFFEAVIVKVRALGFELVSMDEAVARTQAAAAGKPARRFAALTFDDGYRDNRDYALPILRRHNAPFTLYVTTGFAERTARLWWLELEEAVRRAVRLAPGPGRAVVDCATAADKMRVFNQLYWHFRALPENAAMAAIAELGYEQGIDPTSFPRDLCLRWNELVKFAEEPLCTIGAHTLTHPRLAKHGASKALEEMGESRSIIAENLGVEPKHFAYPVGDRTSARPREFAMARELGFVSAVTTRPGMIFAAHAAHLTALPRLSINGNWQDINFVEALLSGAPFALWNLGRRVNVS
jgi:peptidoglycan/xylan/chitin deacetylase (PgdA/CDA1 family)